MMYSFTAPGWEKCTAFYAVGGSWTVIMSKIVIFTDIIIQTVNHQTRGSRAKRATHFHALNKKKRRCENSDNL
jgi:hypothetical protein